MNFTQSPALQSWLDRHGQSFVSHATENHEVIFKSGVIRCAEEILLADKKCEHECGSIRRVTTIKDVYSVTGGNLGNIFQIIYFEKKSKKTNASKFVYILPKFAQAFVFGEKGYRFFLNKDKYQMKERSLFWVFKSLEKETDDIQSAFDRDIRRPTPAERENPYHPYNIKISTMISYIYTQTLRLDEKNHVDPTLREIYRYCLKKRVCPERLEYEIYALRNNIFQLDRVFEIGCDIRVAKNSVWWMYGKIALLIGNPLFKIANRYFPARSEFEDSQANGREFRLKGPYQCDNGYYQVKIDDADNLILGPKSLLDQYRLNPEIPDSVKARFIDLESLTEEQRVIFSLKKS